MDDFKPANPTNTSSDGSLPRPGGGQVMDIQGSKSTSNNDSAPILPEENTVETVTETETSVDAVAEAPEINVAESEVAEESTGPSAEVSELQTETPPEPVSEVSSEASVEASTDIPPASSINVTSMDDVKPAEQSASASVDTSAPATSEQNPLAIPPVLPKKKGGPLLVIVIAVVVAVALAGLVIATFLKSKKDTVGKNTTNSTTTQTAVKPLASPADVDNTNKEIETSLSKVNDTTDFSSADLSDKSLGL